MTNPMETQPLDKIVDIVIFGFVSILVLVLVWIVIKESSNKNIWTRLGLVVRRINKSWPTSTLVVERGFLLLG